MPKKNSGVLISSREIAMPKDEATRKREFASFFDKKAKALCMDRRDVAEILKVDPERFRKIVNQTNPTKKRDCIIACCFALLLGSGETCDALCMYEFPRLDDDLPRDNYISTLLDEQEDKIRSIEKINERLRTRGYKELDIIDHRNGKKATKDSQRPKRYVVLGIKVECRLDEIVYGDQYDSLATEYSPDRYHVVTKMGITDSHTGQDFELIASPEGRFSRIDYPIISTKCFHSYDTLEDAGDLRSYFEIAQSYARQEFAKKAKVLKNSRNYRDRISATVIDNSLHIYTESFNYALPELQEYFLLDYADGIYQFTVADKSRFMELYLSPEVFKEYYGLPLSKILLSFSSEEELKTAADYEKDYAQKAIMRCRHYAYQQMKSRIDKFAKRLNNDVFIVNPNIIDDNDIDLNEYFDVPGEASSWLEDGDLLNGFMLGLRSLEEIKTFKDKHGNLDIRKEFQNRD